MTLPKKTARLLDVDLNKRSGERIRSNTQHGPASRADRGPVAQGQILFSQARICDLFKLLQPASPAVVLIKLLKDVTS